MVSIFSDGVKTAKKRSKHSIDYRCPFCGSRKWVARSRSGCLHYKYKCSSCKCEFDELKQIFIVIDELKDNSNLVECPICGCLYTLGELYIVGGCEDIRIISCECGEMIIYTKIDLNGNRIINVKCIHDLYINTQESKQIW